ncbi:hypothetical protein FA13DRAFT_825421 [Coprinellus micaceus]|uniref:Uncharacterized protein n=1 Tax=Coprinellus micaceus TaxID=71717 RepID=A0A4Y7T310_COPMI|nr:hypothetical protein FA13DRAFT_825421 [Coprinellus micaceus]
MISVNIDKAWFAPLIEVSSIGFSTSSSALRDSVPWRTLAVISRGRWPLVLSDTTTETSHFNFPESFSSKSCDT